MMIVSRTPFTQVDPDAGTGTLVGQEVIAIAGKGIGSGTAFQGVGAAISVQDIIAAATLDNVGAAAAGQHVIVAAAGEVFEIADIIKVVLSSFGRRDLGMGSWATDSGIQFHGHARYVVIGGTITTALG